MREAAADLNFEEAARLRDEVKRLRATELAVMDDPTAKRLAPASGGGGSRAARPGGGKRASGAHYGSRQPPRKPTLDEMGPGTQKESLPYRSGSTGGRPGTRAWRGKRR